MVARAGESRAPRAEGRVVARFNAPRAARVEANANGAPLEVNHRAVALVREEWRVVDRWWTEEPVVRRYFEVVLESGENTVVFHDGAWAGSVVGEAGDARPKDRAVPLPNVWGRTAGAPGAWREVGRPRGCAAVARPQPSPPRSSSRRRSATS